LADFHFAQVTSWEGAKMEHERWMRAHNEQPHWAHRQREDGKRTPAEVLDQVLGHVWTPEHLHRVFFTRRFARWLDKLGYLRFRQWQQVIASASFLRSNASYSFLVAAS
jgi:hypothetical protein